MWETASSLTKVAILAIGTCLFAAVWSSDQRVQAEFAVARRESWNGRHAPRLAKAESEGRIRSPLRSTLQDASIDMELPIGIAPGRYRVIDPGRNAYAIMVQGERSEQADAPATYRYRLANGRIRTLLRIEDASTASRPVHEAAGTSALERR